MNIGKKLGTFLFTALNPVLTWALSVLCLHFFYLPEGIFAAGWSEWLIVFAYTALLLMLYVTYGVFDVGISKVSELVYSQSLSNVLGACALYVLLAILTGALASPLPLLGLILVQTIWSIMYNRFGNILYFRRHQPQKALVVYRNQRDLDWFQHSYRYPSVFTIGAYICLSSRDIASVRSELPQYEAVFMIGLSTAERNTLLEYCGLHDLKGYFIPSVEDVLLLGAEHVKKIDVPTLCVGKTSASFGYLCVKRVMDVVLSAAGLLVLSPLMLATALCILLTDRGPVFYTQNRLTKDGKQFKIYKFRSMRVDAEKDGVARLAAADDDRITPIGRFIRACRIDELPQLFNILRGDMTLVGPRPERPEIAAQYEAYLPQFSLRLRVKAGLTGYAQIYGRYNTEPRDKLLMDLMYINKMSLHEDLKLILATIKILGIRESTAGIDAAQTTAMDVNAQREA